MAKEAIISIVDQELSKLRPDLTPAQVRQLHARGMGIKVLTDLVQSNVNRLINPLHGTVMRDNVLLALGFLREVDTEHLEKVREVIKTTLEDVLAQGENFNCEMP